MRDLTLVEAMAVQKLAEQAAKRLKDSGADLRPGTHEFNVCLDVRGTMSRGTDTEVAQTFKVESFLKAIILHYANTLGKKEGKQWLDALLGLSGSMGVVIKAGANAVADILPTDLQSTWESHVDAAKKRFHATAEKVHRSGQTVVVGEMTANNMAPLVNG